MMEDSKMTRLVEVECRTEPVDEKYSDKCLHSPD